MDLEGLQSAAVSVVAENVKIYQREQEEIAATAAARSGHEEAVSLRSAIYRELASIAVTHAAGWYDAYVESEALPVGEVTLIASDGSTVSRRTHVVIRASYNPSHRPEELSEELSGDVEQLASETPEAIKLVFAVEAEEGDDERGLLQLEATGSRDHESIDGQFIGLEEFDLQSVFIPSALRRELETPKTVLELPSSSEHLSKERAVAQIRVILAETDTMRKSLELIRGTKTAEAQAVDMSFLHEVKGRDGTYHLLSVEGLQSLVDDESGEPNLGEQTMEELLNVLSVSSASRANEVGLWGEVVEYSSQLEREFGSQSASFIVAETFVGLIDEIARRNDFLQLSPSAGRLLWAARNAILDAKIPQQDPELDLVSNSFIDSLELGTHAYLCVKRNFVINTIGDLAAKSKAELGAIPGLGEKTLDEIEGRLAICGLVLAGEEPLSYQELQPLPPIDWVGGHAASEVAIVEES